VENQTANPSLLSAIIALLSALPRILSLIERVGRALSTAEGREWLTKFEATIDGLEKAANKNEKIQAAQNVAAAISTL
jgi:hypothetical protein